MIYSLKLPSDYLSFCYSVQLQVHSVIVLDGGRHALDKLQEDEKREFHFGLSAFSKIVLIMFFIAFAWLQG